MAISPVIIGQRGLRGYVTTSPMQIITVLTIGDFSPPPPVIVGGPEFDAAGKPWRQEPNSFGFDNRMEPK